MTTRLIVSADGHLSTPDGARWPCALGRAGLRADKREGDGATPVGIWPLRRVLFRPDRLDRPPVTGPSGLVVQALAPWMGWCDDPAHPDYNRPVTLPHPAGHERLWRDDALYDVVVVLGHNDDPPRPGAGSAIFLHCAVPHGAGRHGLKPTAGCVALPRDRLLTLLAGLPAGPVALVVEGVDQGSETR